MDRQMKLPVLCGKMQTLADATYERPGEDRCRGSGSDGMRERIEGCLLHFEGRTNVLLGSALAGDEDANAFQHFAGGRRSLGKKGVGPIAVVEDLDAAADKDHGHFGGDFFHAANQFVAVHVRHDEVAEDEVDSTDAEPIHGFLSIAGGDDAIATAGFEEKFAHGEGLFVIVDAEDGFFWSHYYFSLAFPAQAREDGGEVRSIEGRARQQVIVAAIRVLA
jgi:hypothetical protein